MTRSPMVTRDTTSATEALQLMVQRGFRHLVSQAGNLLFIGAHISTSLFAMKMETLWAFLTSQRFFTRRWTRWSVARPLLPSSTLLWRVFKANWVVASVLTPRLSL